MPSQAPALLDYLIAEFTSASTLGQANPPVTVFDGPATTAEAPFLSLYVGLQDPDNEGIETAVSFTQKRSDMGYTRRDETVVVYCCAEAWSGQNPLSIQRTSVFGIISAVEALVRADNTVGGLGFNTPGLTVGDLQQNNTTSGAIARVPFTLTFKSFT